MKARKLVSKGCKVFLAYVRNTTETEVNCRNIRVVREFEDVFPEELLGLPPEREFDFIIDVLFLHIGWHQLNCGSYDFSWMNCWRKVSSDRACLPGVR